MDHGAMAAGWRFGGRRLVMLGMEHGVDYVVVFFVFGLIVGLRMGGNEGLVLLSVVFRVFD